ncbi:MAG TPA: hypothetical protein VF311_10285, partial [Terriglobales bacterium]
MQAFGLSLLLAIPLIWVQRPPQLQWLQPLTSPAAFTPPAATEAARGHHTATAVSNLRQEQIIAPRSIPLHTLAINDAGPPAPELPTSDSLSGRGPGVGVPYDIGDNIPVVIPAHPAAVKPLVVSDLGEGSLLRRVQPIYPSIARQARVQGAVELRAIISKAGTIE